VLRDVSGRYGLMVILVCGWETCSEPVHVLFIPLFNALLVDLRRIPSGRVRMGLLGIAFPALSQS
jgi:hypothetical protein